MRASLLRASQSRRVRSWLSHSKMAHRAVKRFMPGEGLDDALAAAAAMERRGLGALVTQLGEDVTSRDQVETTVGHYLDVLRAISDRRLSANPSVKVTQLGLGIDDSLLDASLGRLAQAAADAGRILWIDMEGSNTTDMTVEAYRRLLAKHDNVGLAMQAYLRRTPADLKSLLPLRPRVRLVKGAYRESPTVALQSRKEVSEAYTQLALLLLESTGAGVPAPTLATHDVALLKSILAAAGVARDRYEVAMLYGIRTPDLLQLAAEGHRCNVLISYGSEWAAWYMRRLAEKPSNLIFGLTAAIRR